MGFWTFSVNGRTMIFRQSGGWRYGARQVEKFVYPNTIYMILREKRGGVGVSVLQGLQLAYAARKW